MKQFVQHALGRFGFEIHRKRTHFDHFRPYVRTFSVAGITFNLWIGDRTGEKWYCQQEQEELAEHTETARLITTGDKVLEIGAHHGFTAMLLSKLVGPQGFVLAIEPSPFNALMAASQIGLNGAANCQVLQAAASDKGGTVVISRDNPENERVFAEGITVPAVTVDELDREYGPFDALKVDVQGFEYQVLYGAKNMLSRRPKILLEVHGELIADYGHTAEEVLGLLDPSYKGTFVSWEDRRKAHPFPGSNFSSKGFVNLFLNCSV
jgi:FkbM family methyltransferase